jgi:hypothetical protein
MGDLLNLLGMVRLFLVIVSVFLEDSYISKTQEDTTKPDK